MVKVDVAVVPVAGTCGHGGRGHPLALVSARARCARRRGCGGRGRADRGTGLWPVAVALMLLANAEHLQSLSDDV